MSLGFYIVMSGTRVRPSVGPSTRVMLGIHALAASPQCKTWMAETGTAMTVANKICFETSA